MKKSKLTKQKRDLLYEYKKGYFDALGFVIREIKMPWESMLRLNIYHGQIMIELFTVPSPVQI